MNYVTNGEVINLTKNIKFMIDLGFFNFITKGLHTATSDIITYKNLIIAVNAYFLEKDDGDDKKNYFCELEFYIPLNRNLPNFSMSSPFSIIFQIFLLLLFIGFSLFGYYDSRPILFILFTLFTIFHIIAMLFTNIGDMIDKRKMGLSREFNKKYIVSGEDVAQIKKVFNEKLCRRLINYNGNFCDLKCLGNKIIMDCSGERFFQDEAEKKVNLLVKQAIDCSIIFNDYDNKNISFSNYDNYETTLNEMKKYFNNQCKEKKVMPLPYPNKDK